MTPYTQDVRCYSCKARMRIAATRVAARRGKPGKTSFKVPCPYCQEDVRGEAPVGLDPASIQVVWYERPAERS
jgi:hypothetical protein